MTQRWKITIFREPQDPPFDHKFHLTNTGCSCAWVARSIPAAVKLVDAMEFHIAHPELSVPVGALGKHVQHVLAAVSR